MLAIVRAPAFLPATLAFLIVGCSWTLPVSPQAGPAPADANLHVRPITDAPVTGPYQRFRPVAPRSWREQNERVAPQPRP
jgi:hypothetical protein